MAATADSIVPVGGDHDDAHFRVPLPNAAQDLDPVHAGHSEIQEDQIEIGRFHFQQRLFTIGCRSGVKTHLSQGFGKCQADVLFIVDNENQFLVHG
jgi:hypothetical protein